MILGAISISIAPLLHRVFPKTNPKIDSYEKELAISVTDIENKLKLNRCDLENNLISKDDFFYNLDTLNIKKEEILAQNKIALSKFIDDHRVIGWKTTRAFWLGFGVRLPYLLLSIIISFLIFKINTEDKYLKKWFFWLQLSCYSISFYFMFWVFWNSPDFTLKAYRWLFITFSILASITTVSFIHYREVFRLKSSLIIEKLIVLLLTNDKYIDTKEKSKKHLEETIENIEEIIF